MQNQHRQLAAILFTDIVGYTALMQENEQKAVALIKHYNAALNEAVGLHNGRVLNYYGDGSLCTFPSVIEALICAIELQKELQSEPNVPLRIGLHVGEVFFENEKALGDGVNVASRIQSLGQANTILFSKEIFDKIRNQPQFKSVSLGLFEFKNVDQPMEVFALGNEGLNVPKKETLEGKLKTSLSKNNKPVRRKIVIGASGGLLLVAGFFIYSTFFKKPGFTGKEKSIVVLPFVNMSVDKDNDYFSDGMTEEITTQLSKIAELKVIDPNSTMSFKDSRKSIKEIAEELGVTSLCKGSVRKEGNDIRITAQLIDANTLQQIWADNWDRQFKEVFAVQSEVARQIAYQLNANLTKEEKKKIEKTPTNSPEAYEFYLQGKQLHKMFMASSFKPGFFENSKLLFEKAINQDPDFAMAHAALANLYNTYTSYVKEDSLMLLSQMKEIQIAWEIDSTNDEILSIRGIIETLTGRNTEKGFEYSKRALELNPNNPSTLLNLILITGDLLGLHDEAKIMAERLVSVDPLSAVSFKVRGHCNFLLNHPQEAAKDLETALRLQPDMTGAMDQLAAVYGELGRFEDTKRMLEKSLSERANVKEHNTFNLAYAYAKLGNV
ncbi:MAG TPA: adenylate/guanylate cyclase domain-containing protein, partial [Chitinophagaceae bacterium]|nr:adenylate/guanylate cyclase domain-containing protein [Chitinophagaceae bacterium]